MESANGPILFLPPPNGHPSSVTHYAEASGLHAAHVTICALARSVWERLRLIAFAVKRRGG